MFKPVFSDYRIFLFLGWFWSVAQLYFLMLFLCIWAELFWTNTQTKYAIIFYWYCPFLFYCPSFICCHTYFFLLSIISLFFITDFCRCNWVDKQYAIYRYTKEKRCQPISPSPSQENLNLKFWTLGTIVFFYTENKLKFMVVEEPGGRGWIPFCSFQVCFT